MLYLADTANLKELEQLYRFFPLRGVTTNPTILKQSGLKLSQAVDKLKDLVGDQMLHMQTISLEADDILREARKYKEYFELGDNFFVKVPVVPEGFRAMQMLKEEGFNVTATAIFTQQQALVAARAGADFVAPYVSRLDNISSHGIQVVADIVQNTIDFDLDTKVLAASFKTVDQVHRVSMAGAQSATVNYDILMQLISHPMTDISVLQFTEDGKGVYDVEF